MHNRQSGNEMEHLGLMVFANPLVIFFIPSSLSFFLFSSLTLPCMPQMFFLVAPTDRNLLARRKTRSSPGERSTKPPVCTQQMQKPSPYATSLLCHMGRRDLIQNWMFFYFYLHTCVCALFNTENQTQTQI